MVERERRALTEIVSAFFFLNVEIITGRRLEIWQEKLIK